MTQVTIIRTFEAAHRLVNVGKTLEYNHEMYGDCANLHGHSYKLEVTVAGAIQPNGMIMNFKDLKLLVDGLFIKRMDHKVLNDVFDFIPTAENLVNYIWDELKKSLHLHHTLVCVRLWETGTCYAERT